MNISSFLQRYHRLALVFDRSVIPHLSVVFTNTTIHSPIGEFNNARGQLMHFLGGGDYIWGYIDGTLKMIQGSSRDSSIQDTKKKKRHGYKYQAVVWCPDGIVCSCSIWVIQGYSITSMWSRTQSVERIKIGRINGQNPPHYLYDDCAWICISSWSFTKWQVFSN
jgi:hypothetical protein